MMYWEGPLLTREQIIEKRRADVRRELWALDCMTELLPLLSRLPEVGDFGAVLVPDFHTLRSRVTDFVCKNWNQSDPEAKAVLDCLKRWGRKSSLPIHAKMVLCSSIPRDEEPTHAD